MTREKLERKSYSNMASLKEEENAMEVRMMSKEEENKQIELFRKRLQKENSRKTAKNSYKKWVAAVALVILLPGSVYAATHHENVKEIWFQYFANSKLKLAKIHDENWGKEESQKEIVYEAFGVKLTIYSCFFDQAESAFYVSYKMEDTSKISRVLGGIFGDESTALAWAEEKEAVCIDVVGVDEKEEVSKYVFGSTRWYNAETGIIYSKIGLSTIIEKKLTPQIEFTKRINDNWTDPLEDWKIEKKKCFVMPKAERLETQTIQAEENKTIKLKVSQQSLVFCVDNLQIGIDDFYKLIREKAKLYTKDKVISLDYSEAYYNDGTNGELQSINKIWLLGGADLSKIEKIEIGEYTFKFSQS